ARHAPLTPRVTRRSRMSSAVCLERRGAIAEITLNRPEVLNAENWAMARELHAVLDELYASKEIRAVIVTGRGRAFSSGVDLKALANGELGIEWFRSFDEAMLRIERLDALTVAKIRGYAIGGGLQVAMACDLRVATPETRFGLPAVMEALIPGMGTYRLPRFIGLGRARRLALTGELIGAEEAQRIGLIDYVVEEQQLDEKVETLIGGVMKGSAVARGFTKRLLTRAFEQSFHDAMDEYMRLQEEAINSEDHRIAME